MNTIHTILFPTDFSETSRTAAVNAVALARLCEARLIVVHAGLLFEDDPYGREEGEAFTILDQPDSATLEAMNAQLGAIDTNGVTLEKVQIRGLTAGRTILEYARDLEPDLIVMGTHGRRGFKRWLMGSVAEEIVRFAPCPVLTIKDSWTGSLASVRRVLVPLDFSLASRPALRTAVMFARLFDAELEVLHVIQPPPYPEVYAWSTSDEFYEDAAQKSRQLIGRLLAECAPAVPTVTHTITGYPMHEIVQTARDRNADLVLMAHLGLTRMAGRPLGSVTEHVVRSAPCPVLTAELSEI